MAVLRPIVAMANPIPDAERGECDASGDVAGERAEGRIAGLQRGPVQREGRPHGQRNEHQYREGEQRHRRHRGDGLGDEHPPASGLPGQQRRHAARGELGADERRTQRPADDGQRSGHSVQYAFQTFAVEPRIVDPGGPVLGKALLGDVVGDLLAANDIVGPQARLDLVVLRHPADLGLLDPPLVILLRKRAAERERCAAAQRYPDRGDEHGHADQPARRDPLQLGDHQPDHRRPSPAGSVRAK